MADSPNYGIANSGQGNINFTESPISYGGKGEPVTARAGGGPSGAGTPSPPITNTGTGAVTIEGKSLTFGPGGTRISEAPSIQSDSPTGGRHYRTWADVPGATSPGGGFSGGGGGEFGDLATLRQFAVSVNALGEGSDFVRIVEQCRALHEIMRDFGGDMNSSTQRFVDAAGMVARAGTELREAAAMVARLATDLSGDGG